ncbi:MAG: hypothetical protein V7634_4784 [Bradyrhizobium sp.]|jgi:hypothetical protein
MPPIQSRYGYQPLQELCDPQRAAPAGHGQDFFHAAKRREG